MSITFEQNKDMDGFFVTIACNFVANTGGLGDWSTAKKAVLVEDITVFISNTGVDEDDGAYDGDIGINYDEATWDDSVDGLIYTDELFLKQVQAELAKIASIADVANDFSYSEQGMQDDGRVSCDMGDRLVERLRKLAIAATQTVA